MLTTVDEEEYMKEGVLKVQNDLQPIDFDADRFRLAIGMENVWEML